MKSQSKQADAITTLVERRLSPEEFRAYVEAPWAEGEREEWLAQVAWFRRRYPTPAARLAATRRAYAAWVRSRT